MFTESEATTLIELKEQTEVIFIKQTKEGFDYDLISVLNPCSITNDELCNLKHLNTFEPSY